MEAYVCPYDESKMVVNGYDQSTLARLSDALGPGWKLRHGPRRLDYIAAQGDVTIHCIRTLSHAPFFNFGICIRQVSCPTVMSLTDVPEDSLRYKIADLPSFTDRSNVILTISETHSHYLTELLVMTLDQNVRDAIIAVQDGCRVYLKKQNLRLTLEVLNFHDLPQLAIIGAMNESKTIAPPRRYDLADANFDLEKTIGDLLKDLLA